MPEIVGFGSRDQSAQHSEHRVGHERSDLHGLIEQCDEEVATACSIKRLRDPARAETITIGLHHAGDGT